MSEGRLVKIVVDDGTAEEEVIRLRFAQESLSLPSLLEALRARFGEHIQLAHLSYVDDEGDRCTVTTENEFSEALRLFDFVRFYASIVVRRSVCVQPAAEIVSPPRREASTEAEQAQPRTLLPETSVVPTTNRAPPTALTEQQTEQQANDDMTSCLVRQWLSTSNATAQQTIKAATIEVGRLTAQIESTSMALESDTRSAAQGAKTAAVEHAVSATVSDANEKVAERTSSQIRELSASYAEEMKRLQHASAAHVSSPQVDFALIAEQTLKEASAAASRILAETRPPKK